MTKKMIVEHFPTDSGCVGSLAHTNNVFRKGGTHIHACRASSLVVCCVSWAAMALSCHQGSAAPAVSKAHTGTERSERAGNTMDKHY